MSALAVPARALQGTALFGAIASLAALAIAFAEPVALTGWLAGVVYWSSLPIGALCLVLIMRVLPGAWRDELAGPSEAALLLLPLAPITFLPVIFALSAVYPWIGAAEKAGFRGIYLSPVFFVARTAIFFAVAIGLALLLLRQRRYTAIGAGGLIVFLLLHTMLSFDWLMSLDPHFHSSGFGLYILSIQATIALALVIAARLLVSDSRSHTGALGGLLLTALMLWAYFGFMQYFISWSDNLPPSVVWYERRAQGIWSPIAYLAALLGLAPILFLFLPSFRRSRLWLGVAAGAVLASKALEVAWITVPAAAGHPAFTGVTTILAFLGLGALTLAAFASALRSAVLQADRPAATECQP